MDLDLVMKAANKHHNLRYYENQWRNPSEIGNIILDLNNQLVTNRFNEFKNSLAARKENPYKYIEYHLKNKSVPDNMIESIKIWKKNNLPIDSLVYSREFEKSLSAFYKSTVTHPSVPGYELCLTSEVGSRVLRIVTDYNENGYHTKVVSNKIYNLNKTLFDNRIKDNTENLTIGDCFWGNLEPYVADYDKMGRFIGYYSECLLYPVHSSFMNSENYFDSIYNRILASVIPFRMKSQVFALKVVDYSSFPSTIIVPEKIRLNSKSQSGDTVSIQVLDTFIVDGNLIEFGTAVTDEDKFHEFLLWQLNNHFFLKYDLKKSNFTYREMINIKNEEKMTDLLRTYNLPCDAKELFFLNQKIGEQNNGLLINKLLKAQMAILYNN